MIYYYSFALVSVNVMIWAGFKLGQSVNRIWQHLAVTMGVSWALKLLSCSFVSRHVPRNSFDSHINLTVSRFHV